MGAGVSYQLRESTSHFLPSLNVRALLNFMIIRNFIYVYNTHCVYINIYMIILGNASVYYSLKYKRLEDHL